MPMSPSKIKEGVLEDLKSTLYYEDLAKASYNEKLVESFARLVNEIHHLDPNFDFENVSEIGFFARFQ